MKAATTNTKAVSIPQNSFRQFHCLSGTEFLEYRLFNIFEQHRNATDGGCDSSIRAINVVIDYFRMQKPQLAERGFLNPLAEARNCLLAIQRGIPHAILDGYKLPSNAPPLTDKERHYRTIVSALVDLAVKDRKVRIPEACAWVARQLRQAGLPIGKRDSGSSDARVIERWRKEALRAPKVSHEHAVRNSVLTQSAGELEDIVRLMIERLKDINIPLE